MSEEATLDEFVEGEKGKTNQQDNEQHLPEIDEIPSDWRLVVVEDITEDLIGGGTPSKSNENYWDGEIPWASVKDLNGIELSETEDYVTEAGVENSATNLIPEDSIVVSTRMTVGEPFLNSTEMAINQDMKAIIPDAEQVNSLFLVYSLWDKDLYLKSLGRGTTVDGITTNDLALTHLGLPSLPEQRKIATVLYTVDRVIEKTEEILEKTHQTITRISQDIVLSGIGHSQYKNVRLGPKQIEVPADWDVTSFGDISDVQQGLQIAKSDRFKQDAEGRYQYITVQYLNDPQDQSNNWYIEDPRETVICDENDVLMTRTGNTGEVITGVSGAFHNNFFKIQFDRELLTTGYLVHYLKSKTLQDVLISYAGTTTIPDLNHGEFFNIPVLLPPIEEQKEIANIISDLNSNYSHEKKYLNQLKRLKRGLMQDLLSGTVRTTDTNIEVPEEVAQYG